MNYLKMGLRTKLLFKLEVGDINMPGVTIKDGESFESVVRRFKKQCEKAGILAEVRKRECYEKPSIEKKKKQDQARKRKAQARRG